jgi:hypothetical protein
MDEQTDLELKILLAKLPFGGLLACGKARYEP